jgi:hypothetical protein
MHAFVAQDMIESTHQRLPTRLVQVSSDKLAVVRMNSSLWRCGSTVLHPETKFQSAMAPSDGSPMGFRRQMQEQ